MLKGFNSIGDIQMYWRICEEDYLQTHGQIDPRLIDTWVKLYSHIIEYQACVICHLSDAQRSRALKAVTDSNKWDAKIQGILGLDTTCKGLISAKNQGKFRRDMDRQLQVMQRSHEVQENILKTMTDIHRDDKEAKLFQDLATKAGDYEWYKNNNPEKVPGTCEVRIPLFFFPSFVVS